MDFSTSEDQQALQEGIRSFCEGSVGIERLQQLENGPGFDRELWKEIAEMGVFALGRWCERCSGCSDVDAC